MFSALKSALAADVDTIDDPAVWKDGDRYRIISGHHRVKAASELGWSEVSVKVFDDPACTELWYRKRLLSVNKTHGDPDDEAVRRFLETSIDIGITDHLDFDVKDYMNDSGYSSEEIALYIASDSGAEGYGSDQEGKAYTKKIKIPHYEIRGEQPSVHELIDVEKTHQLVREIKSSSLPADVEGFLLAAAYRHSIFNYELIAEFYAHASKPVQDLMEKSALVIIDFDKAIENGFTRMSQEIAETWRETK